VLSGLSGATLVSATSLFTKGVEASQRHTHGHHRHRGKHGGPNNHKKRKGQGYDPVIQTPDAPQPTGPATTADAFCPASGFATGFTAARQFAQSFVALRSGQLTSATVNLTSNDDGVDFTMEIRNADALGRPTDVLATTTIADVAQTLGNQPPRTITGTFASPATVIVGHRYALVVTGVPNQQFAFEIAENDPCADGNFFFDPSASGTFDALSNVDLVFATFVTA
jgi:hypothetical protein